ncbi:[citrate (pro-3S)-lyase] ligase [Mesoterricola sediminis]|uniref:Citrate (Pro-3S)-lyase] ligase n=1 Tax=Mesoterricola sediminis TaxID=2927980 RepID=A0AA48GYF7_9BACT|nr:adenylyltransferase/cytidyltransferase family protein [Mesoterricola sediminis]BDU77935.1 citrate (pro-3S)-lyase] ligase [Mesoterricola sediminis]
MIDHPTEREARAFVEGHGLRYEPGADAWAGLYEDGRLVAVGARAGQVLKMFAIAPEHQGTDALGQLVTELRASAAAAGHETLFVFTAPANAPSFEALTFRLLAAHGPAVLLEHGPGLAAWLERQAPLVRPGRNGAIVMNANPFTRGHQYLAETAAARVDHLYLFVVAEDRSAFPYATRLRLAREGTAHLPNVTVLGTGPYAVSAATFPTYFLKRLEAGAEAQMGLDLDLFGRRIAPAFHIAARFAGEEPRCPLTAAYNRAMAELLPPLGVAVEIVPRLEADGAPVSASRVREALAAGDGAALPALVPPTTLAHLKLTKEPQP